MIVLYPSHRATELEQVQGPVGSIGCYVRYVVTYISPMVPPECAGITLQEREPHTLVCASCGVVSATIDQIEQARNAAKQTALGLYETQRDRRP